MSISLQRLIEKNNVIVSESEILTSADDIKVLNMIHGG
jgi:sulfur carrier protein ThiS